MLIENPEQFKAWLTSVLEPLCDADPAALAKYVYALVKKDKTLDELRIGMVEQLDVFLQTETQNFVELLFKTLETQEYSLPNAQETDIKQEPDVDNSTTPPATNLDTISEIDAVIGDDISNHSASSNLNTPSVHVNGTSVPPVSIKRELRKSESEKEEKEREKRPRSRTGRARSRSRSRSRSWERDRRRSRSREHIRIRDRERDRSRPWRNKSPPNSRHSNRHDRRRSRSRSSSPLRSRLRDGPDGRDHRPRFRNRSPTPIRSRSRSRSPDRKKDRPDRTELSRIERLDNNSPGGGTPTQDSNHGDVDMRLSTTSQSIQSVVSVASNQSSFQPKRRCRDFDEKGYCMRGDLCTYDHGIDPVVLEDVVLSRVLTFGPHGAQAPGTVPVPAIPPEASGPNGNAPPPHLPLASLPPPNLRNAHHANMDVLTEYNPDAPSMEPQVPWNRHPPPGPMVYGRGQRELINVPVAPHPNTQEPSHPTNNNPLKRKQAFDFNRLGPKQRNAHNPTNCSLELKKVPRSLNNITQLNNHFSKFGKIVNIQVNFNGDPEAALVTFQLPSEAKAAYRSTEAVLNNRFIKVFWHNTNNSANNTTPPTSNTIENVPPAGTKPSIKERLGATVGSPTKAESPEKQYVPTKRVKEEPDKEKPHRTLVQHMIPKVPPPSHEEKVLAIKKTQEILAAKESIKKKQEEKRKEVIKISSDLRKRKQELLEKQLLEMKVLIEKVEKNPEQKEILMSSIKNLQQSIDSIRKDLASNQAPITTKSNVPKTREQAQKEILDAELDLITAQQEGQDSVELQKRLNELKAQAAAFELNTSPTAGRGARPTRLVRGGHTVFRGVRGRGTSSFAHVSVDHRPTSLLVSGYESEEKDDVIAHFQQFGEILNPIVDDATPSIVINYKSRKEAELAMLKGRTFQDRLLSITWVSGHHLHRGGTGGAGNSTGPLKVSSTPAGSDPLQPITDEEIDLENVADIEALLLDENEEEEDEDGESRSWRR